MTALLDWDTRLFLLLNREWTHPVLDWLMPIVTDFDHWRVPVILLLLLVLARGKAETRVAVLFAILAVVVSDQVCSGLVKPLFDRPRPFKVLADVNKLVGAHASSFPSSHAANTFAAGTFLAMRFRRLIPVLVLPIVVSYSRIYVGVHYPLDVAAGALLGGLIGAGFAFLDRAAGRRFGWMRRGAKETDEGEPDGGESSASPDGV